MLRFSDFAHLPQVDGLVRQLITESRGLTLVTGLDSRPSAEGAEQFLPSGRATIFRILVSEILDAHPGARCVVVTADKDALRAARRLRPRLEVVLVKPPLTAADAIYAAAAKQPGLLVVDQITAESIGPLLSAARQGVRAVSQLDTAYHAADVTRHLSMLGATEDNLAGLEWVISLQRMPALCPICRRPAEVTEDDLAQLTLLGRHYPLLSTGNAPSEGGTFFEPAGCPKCYFTGRQGDVAVFDFYRCRAPGDNAGEHVSVLPMKVYAWMLAQRGQLALSDALDFESYQMRRSFNLLLGNERVLAETGAALERRNVALETANRLLQQRTRELVSLEGIGQALITWQDLRDLGARVVNSAVELCKADRGILYYTRSNEWAQILAAYGWREAQVGYGLARSLVYAEASEWELTPYVAPPPGLELASDSPRPRAGLAIPLVAHGVPAGLMIIQSTRKRQFAQGEVALLKTLANHAAIAMQRAGLVEQLQAKIDALERAQRELIEKERLERELELARQLQQRMIPASFPEVSGLEFAANYAPARHVGGDFYDVIKLDDKRVGLVIADVSDKGMAAALYMALARSFILATARQVESPREVLSRVNRLLLELGEQDMFVTVFYGVIELSSGRLTYARAGHDYPILLRDGAATMLGGRGMPLGLFPEASDTLTEENLPVRPGDRLVLYTDGLTDVINPSGLMLGLQGLTLAMIEHVSQHTSGFCTSLFADLDTYQADAPQFDDMALLTVTVT